jgi:hypothetical protein
MSGSKAINTTMTINTIGVMCNRRSLKVRPARLAMMMFGGSPTRVNAPPMFEARISRSEWHRVDLEPFAHHWGDERDEQDRGDVVQ